MGGFAQINPLMYSFFYVEQQQMMCLVVPLLVSLLPPPPPPPPGHGGSASASASRETKVLGEQALQKLMRIGPRYPEAFRSVMQQFPSLKQRLEGAIHSSQSAAASSSPAASRQAAAAKSGQKQAPSIKLKMDFSNFK